MAFYMGIDTGGTFTDLVVLDEKGEFHMYKSPTTPKNHAIGIFNCIKQCAEERGMDVPKLAEKMRPLLVHGCTIATNAIIEWKGAKTGIITSKGRKWSLWMMEGNKKEVFDLTIPWPRPLVPPYLCLDVPGRINSEGEELIPLDEKAVRNAIRQFKEWNVQAIGVCLLWSIANDSHEKRVKEILEEEWPGIHYSISSDVQPIIREYHRTCCVAFDAMLKPIMTKYVHGLEDVLAKNKMKRDFLMVVSSGGLLTAQEVIKRPVNTLFSGPAMGPSAGLYYAEKEGVDNCVVVDMGGTSFDVSTVIDGMVSITRDARVGAYPTGVTSVDVLTLGAGGGSIAWVEKGGLLRVGPESAGAEPGPACYGKGGESPTVTDANVVLGYIDPEYFWGGRMKIDPKLSRKAVQDKVARPLKISTEEAAAGIYRVINTNMVGGIIDMTVKRGIDPREFVLVSGGGAGSIHAAAIAKELEMRRVIIPNTAPVLCASGMLNADINFSFVASKFSTSRNFDFEGINTLLAELEGKAGKFLDGEGIPEEKRRYEYFVAARYFEQPHSTDMPLKYKRLTPETLEQLVLDFHDIHEKRYQVRDEGSHVEFTEWRVVGIGEMPKLELKELPASGEDSSKVIKKQRKAYFVAANGFVDTPIYDGTRLGRGMIVEGPAVIEDSLTTTVVIPDSILTVDKFGSYIMELEV